jgi:D-alanyl-D-alanine dipeptidase
VSADITRSLAFLANSPDFFELKSGDGLRIDLRYGSTNNFVGYDMYGPFTRAFLHKFTAGMLFAALKRIRAARPDHGFIIFDALRPRSVQRVLWKHVVGTEGEKYIANPDLGSLHNFGFAVDLSVVDGAGRELDMGAGYDDFRPIAQPQLEEKFVREGLLTDAHMANRKFLRQAMESAGFIQLPHEWWHFDALPKAEVRARFQIVE